MALLRALKSAFFSSLEIFPVRSAKAAGISGQSEKSVIVVVVAVAASLLVLAGTNVRNSI